MSEDTQTPVETPVETTDTVEQPGMLNDEGNFNADWLQGLPDELGIIQYGLNITIQLI